MRFPVFAYLSAHCAYYRAVGDGRVSSDSGAARGRRWTPVCGAGGERGVCDVGQRTEEDGRADRGLQVSAAGAAV